MQYFDEDRKFFMFGRMDFALGVVVNFMHASVHLPFVFRVEHFLYGKSKSIKRSLQLESNRSVCSTMFL